MTPPIENPQNKRIIILDPSTLAHVECLRYIQLSNIEGLQSKLGSDPLDFGQALHRGIAAFYTDRIGVDPMTLSSGKYYEIAREYYASKLCPKLPPRTFSWLSAAMTGYIDEYREDPFSPLFTDDKSKITLEIPFRIKIYENEHTIVILSGVIDAVGFNTKDSRRLLYIRDTKHSSTTKKKSHMEEQLSLPQFHIYSWSMAKIGYNSGKYMPIQIDAVYLDPKVPRVDLVRSDITPLDDYMIERTMSMVMFYAKLIADQLPSNVHWPHNYKACHGKYRLCEFSPLCKSPTDCIDIPKKVMFQTRVYDPTTFGE